MALSRRLPALHSRAWSGWNGILAGLQPRDVLRRRNHASLGDGGAYTFRGIVKEYRPGPECVLQTPGAPLYIFPGNLPNSLEQDKAEIGGEKVASKYQYTFRMRSMEPTISNKAGEVRIVDSHNFPVSKKVSAALLTIKPGHMREIHWHPNGSEWQYYIAGKARMTVFFPVDNARTMDFKANDVGYVPSNAAHYVENTGNTDLVVLELFATDQFMDVSLNQWLRRVPSEMLKAHLNIDEEMAMKIPAEKLELV